MTRSTVALTGLAFTAVLAALLTGLAPVAPAADPPDGPPPSGDRELATELAALAREADRVPDSVARAEVVATLYARTFRRLGLFPPAPDAPAEVRPADLAHLEAAVAARPAARRPVLDAVDHWLVRLGRSDPPAGRDPRWRATRDGLRAAALRLDADVPDGPPFGRIRKALVDGDAKTLTALFEGDAALPEAALRQLPGDLFVQTFDVMMQGRPGVLRGPFATRQARLRPADPALNALLVAESRDPAQASRYAHALVLGDPDNPAYRAALGRALYALATRPGGSPFNGPPTPRDGDDPFGVAEAVWELELAVRLNAAQGRADPLTHYHLGRAYDRTDERWGGAAVAAFEAAVREAALPGQGAVDAAGLHLPLARALQDLGRDPHRVAREAERCVALCGPQPLPLAVPGVPSPGWDFAFDYGPDELVEAYLVLGRAYLDLGRAGDAVPPLAAAVRHRPRRADCRLWLGKAYQAFGDTPRAVEAAEQATRLAPADPEGWVALGEHALSGGDPKRAGECFAWAAALAARTARSVRAEKGVEEAARQAELQPVVAAVVAGAAAPPTPDLARAAAAGKRYTTAARVLRAVLEADPDPGEVAGGVRRLAVGAAARAGRGGLFGDADRQPGDEALHALAREWADEELRRVRAELGRRAAGEPRLTREELLDRLTAYQTDPLLAAVREPAWRARLGAAERRSWETFWDGWNEAVLAVRGLPPGDPHALRRGAGGLDGF